MVILGAGASYDSVGAVADNQSLADTRLPLAKDLFESRETFKRALNQYPRIAPIATRLVPNQNDRGFNIEERLQALWNEKHAKNAGQFMALRYYIREIIDQTENAWLRTTSTQQLNLLALFDEIERMGVQDDGPVLLVTFNYDTESPRVLRRLS